MAEFVAATGHVRKLRIPLQFQLAENEVASIEKPDPVFLTVARGAYLPVLATEIVEYYRQFALDFDNHPLFTSSSGDVFQGYLHIGVLYDLHMCSRTTAPTIEPMIIIIRFQISTGSAVDYLNVKTIEKCFFQNIKQANHVLFGGLSHYNKLSLEQQHSLWHQAQHGDTTLDYISSEIVLLPEGQETNIPLRLVISSHNSLSSSHIIQKSVPFQIASIASIDRILRDHVVPTMTIMRDQAIVRLITHGVDVPLNATLYDIWRLFRSNDLFLYLLVVQSA